MPVMSVHARQTAMMFIAAVIVCGLLELAQWDSDDVTLRVTSPGSLVVALYPPFQKDGDLAWRAVRIRSQDMKALLPYADDPAAAEGHSPVMVYEDGRPLGPAHSNFADISKLGHGRFTFWTGQGLFFSTSDGSNPNDNGRRYWAVVP